LPGRPELRHRHLARITLQLVLRKHPVSCSGGL